MAAKISRVSFLALPRSRWGFVIVRIFKCFYCTFFFFFFFLTIGIL